MYIKNTTHNIKNVKDFIRVNVKEDDVVTIICESISFEWIKEIINLTNRKNHIFNIIIVGKGTSEDILEGLVNERYDFIINNFLEIHQTIVKFESLIHDEIVNVYRYDHIIPVSGGVIRGEDFLVHGIRHLRKSDEREMILMVNNKHELMIDETELEHVLSRKVSVKNEVCDVLSFYSNILTISDIFAINIHNIQKENEYIELVKRIDEQGIKESKIWNMLYQYQVDGALSLIYKVERIGGAILTDSVGLGKTFTSLAVISYFNSLNHYALVIAPKKIAPNWEALSGNNKHSILKGDNLKFDVMYHSTFRSSKTPTGTKLEDFNFSKYKLIVIDESHNFRNSESTTYKQMLKYVLEENLDTKVLLLTATPINNSLNDLASQMYLINRSNNTRVFFNSLSENTKSLNYYAEINRNEKLINDTGDISVITEDYKRIIHSYFVNRNRQYIKSHYKADINFPERKMHNVNYINDIQYIDNIYGIITNKLTLAIYTPLNYVSAETKSKYGMHRGREHGLQSLMTILLLKRLDSSFKSFKQTIDKMIFRYENALSYNYLSDIDNNIFNIINEIDFDDDEMDSQAHFGEYSSSDNYGPLNEDFKKDIQRDIDLLKTMRNYELEKLDNSKLVELLSIITNHVVLNQKLIIFTTYSDTAFSLYENVRQNIPGNLKVGLVTGSESQIDGKRVDQQSIIDKFKNDKEFRVLIATDVLSEGQNLQVANNIVHYDIHWNPVRLIQREGRVDRIGSVHSEFNCYYFWPAKDIESYIKLKSKINRKSRASLATGIDSHNSSSNNKFIHDGYADEQEVEMLLKVQGGEDIIPTLEKRKELITFSDIRKYEEMLEQLQLSSNVEKLFQNKEFAKQLRSLKSIYFNDEGVNEIIFLIHTNREFKKSYSLVPYKMYKIDLNTEEIEIGDEVIIDYMYSLIDNGKLIELEPEEFDEINDTKTNVSSYYKYYLHKVIEKHNSITTNDINEKKFTSIVSAFFNVDRNMSNKLFKEVYTSEFDEEFDYEFFKDLYNKESNKMFSMLRIPDFDM